MDLLEAHDRWVNGLRRTTEQVCKIPHPAAGCRAGRLRAASYPAGPAKRRGSPTWQWPPPPVRRRCESAPVRSNATLDQFCLGGAGAADVLKPGQRASMDDEERVWSLYAHRRFSHFTSPRKLGRRPLCRLNAMHSGEVSVPHHTCHKRVPALRRVYLAGRVRQAARQRGAHCRLLLIADQRLPESVRLGRPVSADVLPQHLRRMKAAFGSCCQWSCHCERIWPRRVRPLPALSDDVAS